MTISKPSKRNGAALIKSVKPYSNGVLERNELVKKLTSQLGKLLINYKLF